MKKLEKYNEIYGKLNGYIKAKSLGLQTSNRLELVLSKEDLEHIDFIKDKKYICRPDSPIGKGNKLPRGRDLKGSEIGLFLEEIQNETKDAVLLVFNHPTEDIYGAYKPRYKTNGAFTISVIDNKILINIVGDGFDVGDISRGETLHYSIESRFINGDFDFKIIYKIGEDKYLKSRIYRINNLTEVLKENDIEDIEKSIPEQLKSLDEYIEILKNKCISYLIKNGNLQLENNSVVMGNIYGNEVYIFEIYEPQRSIGLTKNIFGVNSNIYSDLLVYPEFSKSYNLGLVQKLNLHIPNSMVLSKEIILKISNGTISDAEIIKLKNDIKNICGDECIVRSNNGIEDGKIMSHAGFFESKKSNIENIEKVIKEVLLQNLDILTKLGYDFNNLGILIQSYIIGDCGGVLFTKNPYSSEEILIEYESGNNHNIVNGSSQPLNISLDKKNYEIKGGYNEKNLLPIGKIIESLEILKKVFNFDVDIDIEFVIKGDYFIILQIRFITTLNSNLSKNKALVTNTNIEGQWISGGVINGNLHLVKNNKDVFSINTKTIVVTDKLSPILIEKIELIEGIITEKGGVTSHLAIVCRELKIPIITNLDGILKYIESKKLSKVLTVKNNITLM